MPPTLEVGGLGQGRLFVVRSHVPRCCLLCTVSRLCGLEDLHKILTSQILVLIRPLLFQHISNSVSRKSHSTARPLLANHLIPHCPLTLSSCCWRLCKASLTNIRFLLLANTIINPIIDMFFKSSQWNFFKYIYLIQVLYVCIANSRLISSIKAVTIWFKGSI